MILDQLIEMTISRNGKHFRSLGYGKCRQGDVIFVKPEHLTKGSQKVVKAACDECGEVFERNIANLRNTEVHRCKTCRYADTAKRMSENPNLKTFHGPEHCRWNPNKSEWKTYYAQVMKVTRLQPIHELKNFDKPRGVCGQEGAYQLDHIISIKKGFDENISPDIIGDITNLQFVTWEQNRQKST